MKAFLAVAIAAGLLAGGGCGNGHDHSKHDHGDAKAAKSDEKVKDPVCGMTIDKSASKAHEEYKGGHYYFCSAECHAKFKADPEKYVKK